MIACAKMGMNFVACGPEELKPRPDIFERCQEIARETSASVSFTSNLEEALAGADVVYGRVGIHGEEDKEKERISL